jgi:hypothetical protein
MRLALPLLAVTSSLLLCAATAAPPDNPPADGYGAAPPQTAQPGRRATTQSATGSLTYRARVVHNNRSAISYVDGRVDFASGDFEEHVEQSYLLDWKQLPGRMAPAPAILPSVWSAGGHYAQQLGHTLPRFDSPLLRHFIIGQLLARPESLVKDAQFLAGQLVIGSADFSDRGFEVVASFRGAPLVLVGSRVAVDGRLCISDLAVLGPSSELYQYFFEQQNVSGQPLSPRPALPVLDRGKYVDFPRDGASPVAIRPVKDWLVFQATLPGGRPLNLVFDSGAEQMIVDDLVLRHDAHLEPTGEISVSGPAGDEAMQLYEGFSFEVGGVQFRNLSVAGTALTRLGYGADLRIHGVVGNEILQLCKLDLDLDSGQLMLSLPGTTGGPESAPAAQAQELPLTFIRELPHVEGAVQDGQPALLLLDTGQRSPLSVNLDYLEHYKLGDELKMNGFLGDITGGLLPRYIVEELPFSLAGETYTEKAVDAAPEYTFSYGGVPVAGAIGFPLLARHFGGITFDYSRKLLWLRNPGENRTFAGQVAAWTVPAAQPRERLAAASPASERDRTDDDALADEVQARSTPSSRASAPAQRRIGLDDSYSYGNGGQAHASNPNTPERAAQMREEARQRREQHAHEQAAAAEQEQAARDSGTAEAADGDPADGGADGAEENAQSASGADETAAPGTDTPEDQPAEAAPADPAPNPAEAEEPAFRLKPARHPLKRS